MSDINYDLMRREYPELKGALTRAVKSTDAHKVLAEVERAFARFDVWGAWPDDWSRWERAKRDAEFALRRQQEDW